MMRISDIIKMGPQNDPDDKKEKKDTPAPSLLDKAIRKSANSTIEQLYNAGIDLLKDIFNKARQGRHLDNSQIEIFILNSLDFKAVTDYINQITDRILLGDDELFNYFYNYREKENYIYEHSLNVCLLSVKIGIWMDMNKSDLVNIALGGLLHDIGLIAVEDIISLPRKLKHNEIEAVKKHSLHSANMLEKIKGVAEDVVAAVKAHHTRLGDENFTRTLTHDKLQKMAQIIGLADVYEALTHQRSYKSAKLPHEAVKELIEQESGNFQAKIIKSLVENIGIYPIGSWVRLTDGSIGFVASVNKGYPLRPKVNIMFDAKGNKFSDIKSIDLLNEPHLHIESPIDLEKNSRLIEKLKQK
ncbi:MAG: HD domain-containing protein [Candidatus Omnitrophica bacterium]|nr:HD domain-containing protein [Candidatus Omnitrophota bacterium]